MTLSHSVEFVSDTDLSTLLMQHNHSVSGYQTVIMRPHSQMCWCYLLGRGNLFAVVKAERSSLIANQHTKSVSDSRSTPSDTA